MNEQIEWVIVPKIPTQAMLDAELGLRHWDTKPSYESRRDLRPHIYAAMIAAAPKPPSFASQWIPVSERLPLEADGTVAVPLDELRRIREEALSAGFGSGRWILGVQALMDAFPHYYAAAKEMNEKHFACIAELNRLKAVVEAAQEWSADRAVRAFEMLTF